MGNERDVQVITIRSFTPSAAGTYVFRLTVNDGAASATDDIQVTVNTGTVFINLPGRLQAGRPGAEKPRLGRY